MGAEILMMTPRVRKSKNPELDKQPPKLDPLNISTSGCEQLWFNVLGQAINDYLAGQPEMKDWFRSRNFQIVCDLARISPESVYRVLYKLSMRELKHKVSFTDIAREDYEGGDIMGRVFQLPLPPRHSKPFSRLVDKGKEMTTLNYAKDLLGSRLTEKRGCYYLDDYPVSLWRIIEEANVVLSLRKEPPLKLERIKW